MACNAPYVASPTYHTSLRPMCRAKQIVWDKGGGAVTNSHLLHNKRRECGNFVFVIFMTLKI